MLCTYVCIKRQRVSNIICNLSNDVKKDSDDRKTTAKCHHNPVPTFSKPVA